MVYKPKATKRDGENNTIDTPIWIQLPFPFARIQPLFFPTEFYPVFVATVGKNMLGVAAMTPVNEFRGEALFPREMYPTYCVRFWRLPKEVGDVSYNAPLLPEGLPCALHPTLCCIIDKTGSDSVADDELCGIVDVRNLINWNFGFMIFLLHERMAATKELETCRAVLNTHVY